MDDFPDTFADFHAWLGGIPLDRIRMTPTPGTATEADLISAWTTPPYRCPELVGGTLVEKISSFSTAAILQNVGPFVKTHDLGVCLHGCKPFRLRSNLIRIPSFTFTPWQRLPNQQLPNEEIASFVPALVVEVSNASNTAAELERKVREYFSVGCNLTWIIDPRARTARVYTTAKQFSDLDENDTLDGGKVLPGFQLKLADLFVSVKRRRQRLG